MFSVPAPVNVILERWEIEELIELKRSQMHEASRKEEFCEADRLKRRIAELKKLLEPGAMLESAPQAYGDDPSEFDYPLIMDLWKPVGAGSIAMADGELRLLVGDQRVGSHARQMVCDGVNLITSLGIKNHAKADPIIKALRRSMLFFNAINGLISLEVKP